MTKKINNRSLKNNTWLNKNSGKVSENKRKAEIKDKKNINNAILIILLLTIISYWPSLCGDFVGWDDEAYLHENIATIGNISLKGIGNIFSSYNMSNYHPLTILLYSIEYYFAGLNPFLYHFTNVLIHMMNVLLVFWLGFKLSGKITVAIVCSLLFSVHPLHVESVSWISETKDVLYGFFFLCSIICYINYSDQKHNKKYYFYSLFLFILSCLSKGLAVSLPIVLLLIDYLKVKKFTINLFTEKIPFFIIALIFGLIAISAQNADQGFYNTSAYTIADKLFLPFYACLFYIYKMLLPFNLAIIYPYPSKVANALPLVYYFAPFIFILILSLIIYSAKYTKLIIFAGLFYLSCILLVVQILPVGISLASDRYFYIASLGIFYSLGEGFDYLYKKKLKNKYQLNIYITTLFVIIILSLSYLTYQRAGVWENNLTLWSDLLKTQPDNDKAYYGIGTYYFKKDSTSTLALNYYKKALNLNPSNYKALNNLGNCYLYKKQPDSAFICYQKQVIFHPEYKEGYQNLGNYFYSMGNYQKAIGFYNKAIAIDRNYAQAYYTLGICYFALKDFDKANENIFTAIKLGDPSAKKLVSFMNSQQQ